MKLERVLMPIINETHLYESKVEFFFITDSIKNKSAKTKVSRSLDERKTWWKKDSQWTRAQI